MDLDSFTADSEVQASVQLVESQLLTGTVVSPDFKGFSNTNRGSDSCILMGNTVSHSLCIALRVVLFPHVPDVDIRLKH